MKQSIPESTLLGPASKALNLNQPINAALCFAPLVALALLLLLRLVAPGFYLFLVEEDGPLESLQSLAYLSAAVIAVIVALRLNRRDLPVGAWLFILFAIGAVFAAGEEISWGQRVLGFDTPPVMEERNVQSEFTLHNIDIYQKVIHEQYVIIAFAAAFAAWLIPQKWITRRSLALSYAIPARVLTLWFIPAGIYYLYGGLAWNIGLPNFFATIRGIELWRDQESFETLFAFAFLLFTLTNLKSLHNAQPRSSFTNRSPRVTARVNDEPI